MHNSMSSTSVFFKFWCLRDLKKTDAAGREKYDRHLIFFNLGTKLQTAITFLVFLARTRLKNHLKATNFSFSTDLERVLDDPC